MFQRAKGKSGEGSSETRSLPQHRAALPIDVIANSSQDPQSPFPAKFRAITRSARKLDLDELL